MHIGFKLIRDGAKLPSRGYDDIGYDIYSAEDIELKAHSNNIVKTGLQMSSYDGNIELPGSVTLTCYPKIECKSSFAIKSIFPVGCIVDPSYRGEICVVLLNVSDTAYTVKAGDKIAQIVFTAAVVSPNIDIIETTYVDDTRRGSGGFGSTGRT